MIQVKADHQSTRLFFGRRNGSAGLLRSIIGRAGDVVVGVGAEVGGRELDPPSDDNEKDERGG